MSNTIQGRIFFKLSLPYLFFLGAYLFAYLPYFIWCAIPDIQLDTYSYMFSAYSINHDQLPLSNLAIDAPMGYPLFIALVKSISANTGAVIIIQNVIYVLSSLLMIRNFKKIAPLWGWIAAIGLALYTHSSYTMRLNTALFTEGLYISALILVCSLLVPAYFKPGRATLFALAFCLFIPAIIRSNGIYIYFLVPALLLLAWQNKWGKYKVSALLLGTIAGCLVWSSLNYFTKGVFFIGDLARIKVVANRTINESVTGQAAHAAVYNTDEKFLPRKWRLFKAYAGNPAVQKPSFYYSFIKSRYVYLFTDSVPFGNAAQAAILQRPDLLPPAVKRYTIQGLEDKTHFKDAPRIADINHAAENRWIWLIHIVYKAYGVLIGNLFWVLLYFFITLYCGLAFFARLPRVATLRFIALLSAIHFLSIIAVTLGHPRSQIRYGCVSEFVIFVVIGLFVAEVILPGVLKKTKIHAAE